MELGFWIPGRIPARGASEVLVVVVLAGAVLLLRPSPEFVDSEGLDARAAGGPMEVLFPPRVGLGFTGAIEGGLLEGVEVRGVEEPEFTTNPSCLVGDFVGDCGSC